MDLPWMPIRNVPEIDSPQIVLPLAELPSREKWEQKAKASGAEGHHARVQLARLDQGLTLPTRIEYPIRIWRFGKDLAMVFLPGEVVVDYALRLKRELDGHRLWLNGYSNGCPGYVPSERILREGGYEGGGAMIYFDIPGPYAAGLEQKIVDAVRQPLLHDFAARFDSQRTRGTVPRPATMAVASLRTLPGYSVQLVASEPLISSPVAIDFSADGKLWVAEMVDYPTGTAGDYQPGGRVRMLEDSDGDGQYDRSRIFLANIPFPTGVTAWRKGVLVCAAPDILYAEDQDGDGTADLVKKLYSGFGTENYQGRVNSLRYGLDGWIYGACGLFGGRITNEHGDRLELGNRDFRIRPDLGQIEPVTGTTQQGRVRNDWGDWFGCDNSTLIRHYPIEDRYTRRNPALPAPVTSMFHHRNADPGQLFPISNVTMYPLSGPPGRVTAACGLEIYRDRQLGIDFQGDAFTCEPVANLVHHLRLSQDGVTFAGDRTPGEAQREFLASNDPWFRPVQARSAPDGGLWVVDMYRFVIEHPRWIPPETVAALDVRAGHDRGRIYRVIANDQRHVPTVPRRLDQRSNAELVSELDSPNGWQRDMAQQLLVERQAIDQVDGLRQLAASSMLAEARLHALCTLDLLGDREDATLIARLRDPHPGVRRHAVRIAEAEVNNSPKIADALMQMLNDPDPQVQLQLSWTLGAWNGSGSALPLSRLLARNHADRVLVWAALTSLNRENFEELVRRVVNGEATAAAREALLPTLVTLSATLGTESTLSIFARQLAAPGASTVAKFAVLRELLSASAKQKQDLAARLDGDGRQSVDRLIELALAAVSDQGSDEEQCLSAIRLLGALPATESRVEILRSRMAPRNAGAVQAAALDALGQIDDTQASTAILTVWNSATPAVRKQILEILLRRERDVLLLLDTLASGGIQVADIDAVHRARLLEHKSEPIRDRAAGLFNASAGAREDVVRQYRDLGSLTADRVHGKAVFAKSCAPCHRLDGVGAVVGQNLAALTNRSTEALLVSIFDPSRQVDERFVAYIATTVDGRSFSGILAGESSSSITLRGQEGKEQTFVRSELDELRSTGKSLMPEGLEKDLTRQDVADLLAYLAESAPPPKQIPGNAPVAIRADGRGTLVLSAAAAAISGNDITFESEFQNIGYWHGEGDRVDWTCELASAAEYDVWLDYACNDDSQRNRYLLEAGGEPLRGVVIGTGGWDQYRRRKIGTLRLPAGSRPITLRPDGPLMRPALMDLRAVVLEPAGREPDWAAITRTLSVRRTTVDPRFSSPADYARRILDPAVTDAERTTIIQSQPQIAAELIAALVDGLEYQTAQELQEQYRRIPWIWRVAIAAGKRNEPAPMRRILAVSLPRDDEPLRDWQAVVIGGGIINGISQTGEWPARQLEALLEGNPELLGRYRRALELAATMADDVQVNTGTRYDALRMLGVESWDRRGKQLVKYLPKEVHGELQMGAVSGLADVDRTEAGKALAESLRFLEGQNRALALDALLRNSERREMLRQAIAAGIVHKEELNESQRGKLK
jgi:putative membrane-bound dehydrogenase-like protein